MTGKSARLAGGRTSDEWRTLRETLIVGGDPLVWRKAIDAFLIERLETRYFIPIRLLRSHLGGRGEGFAIVALQCSVIEFLAALRKGWHHTRHVDDVGPPEYAYSDSGRLFVDFLVQVPPFKGLLTRRHGERFYSEVRCGLIHETMTKSDWRIRVRQKAVIDGVNKTVDRNRLQELLESYVSAYRREIEVTPALQAAFLRKFDVIAA